MGYYIDLPDATKGATFKAIYDWIAANTTSVVGVAELIAKGWGPLIQHGIITVTSNGYVAWGLNNAGELEVGGALLTTVDASTSKTAWLNRWRTLDPTIATRPNIEADYSKLSHRLALKRFTSDASGNIAADQELVAALAGYYGAAKFIGLFSVGNAGGVATLVIQNGAAVDLITLVSGTLAAGQLDTKNQDMIITSVAATDNSAIYIDTTSSGLGNAQDYIFVYEYWYET